MSYGQTHHVNNPYTAEEIETALQAMVAWAGNASQARRYLESKYGLQMTSSQLSHWKNHLHAARYDEIREKYAEGMEARIAHEQRDLAMLAAQTQRLAVERAHERLEAGEDQDPAKSAANLAKVAQSNVDKLMTLTNRPQQITETRNIQELVRSLAALGLIRVPDEPQQQITEASVAE